jgi:hypothetical protein
VHNAATLNFYEDHDGPRAVVCIDQSDCCWQAIGQLHHMSNSQLKRFEDSRGYAQIFELVIEQPQRDLTAINYTVVPEF